MFRGLELRVRGMSQSRNQVCAIGIAKTLTGLGVIRGDVGLILAE